MRMSVAGFVDVGFVRAAVASACGLDAGQVRLDAGALVRKVDQIAEQWGGSRLRVYWYDGAHGSEDPRHQTQRRYLDAVAATPGVQLRLGNLVTRTPAWHRELESALKACGVDRKVFDRHFKMTTEVQQKGVDTLMVLDLVRLAQRGAYDVAVIFSGDRDIAEAVRAAQDEGRRVVLVVPDERSSATDLRSLADEVVVLDAAELRTLHRASTRTPGPRPAPERNAATKPDTTTQDPSRPTPEDDTQEQPAAPAGQDQPARDDRPAVTEPAAPEPERTPLAPPAFATPPAQSTASTEPAERHDTAPGPVPAEPAAPSSPAPATDSNVATHLFGDPEPDMAGELFGDQAAEPDMAGALFGDAPPAGGDVAGELFGAGPQPVWGAPPPSAPPTFGSLAL